ncbi:MAG TPA: hypothetical protein VE398_16540 [Acidobacteriota bacterium]|nr:hypothetical protein [Acidobacteriota bacterium]
MNITTKLAKSMLLAGFLAGSICVSPAGTQSPAPARQPSAAGAPFRNAPNRFSRRAEMYYQGVWGIDSLRVKYTESGEMIRFSWTVLDPAKAALLNDKKAEPSLIDPQAGVKLVVPQMEKVGKLRQSSTPVAGQSYWMAFSNKGRLVKRGHRVTIVIGQFRADWLEVD